MKAGVFSDDRGQIYTMEGIVAAIVLLLAVYFIINSISVVSPQTERSLDMKLAVRSQDALNILTASDYNHPGDLKSYIVSWNGTDAGPGFSTGPGEWSCAYLNGNLSTVMPNNSMYNVMLRYNNSNVWESHMVVYNGEPHDNAVTASQIVVLNRLDNKSMNMSKYWANVPKPVTVEVKMFAWYI